MSRADLKLEYTADHEKITVAAKGSQVILAVLWTDLASVCVITTSGGPFTEDCFIEVTSAKGNSFEIPNSKLHGSFLFDKAEPTPWV